MLWNFVGNHRLDFVAGDWTDQWLEKSKFLNLPKILPLSLSHPHKSWYWSTPWSDKYRLFTSFYEHNYFHDWFFQILIKISSFRYSRKYFWAFKYLWKLIRGRNIPELVKISKGLQKKLQQTTDFRGKKNYIDQLNFLVFNDIHCVNEPNLLGII